MIEPNLSGRLDVHSHLLPGVDDGCASIDDSIACAKLYVEAGYSHVICTPHIWPGLKRNTTANIIEWVGVLQEELVRRHIPLTLSAGGEINLTPAYMETPPAAVVTYGGRGRYCLFDLWADRLPPHFEPSVKRLQSFGLKVIIAHPERMKAVQDDPSLADYFADLGLLLQGNLYCLVESELSPRVATRTAQLFLRESRYFVLGSDCHKPDSLPVRFAGLQKAIELVGAGAVDLLTRGNAGLLLA